MPRLWAMLEAARAELREDAQRGREADAGLLAWEGECAAAHSISARALALAMQQQQQQQQSAAAVVQPVAEAAAAAVPAPYTQLAPLPVQQPRAPSRQQQQHQPQQQYALVPFTAPTATATAAACTPRRSSSPQRLGAAHMPLPTQAGPCNGVLRSQPAQALVEPVAGRREKPRKGVTFGSPRGGGEGEGAAPARQALVSASEAASSEQWTDF